MFCCRPSVSPFLTVPFSVFFIFSRSLMLSFMVVLWGKVGRLALFFLLLVSSLCPPASFFLFLVHFLWLLLIFVFFDSLTYISKRRKEGPVLFAWPEFQELSKTHSHSRNKIKIFPLRDQEHLLREGQRIKLHFCCIHFDFSLTNGKLRSVKQNEWHILYHIALPTLKLPAK